MKDWVVVVLLLTVLVLSIMGPLFVLFFTGVFFVEWGILGGLLALADRRK